VGGRSILPTPGPARSVEQMMARRKNTPRERNVDDLDFQPFLDMLVEESRALVRLRTPRHNTASAEALWGDPNLYLDGFVDMNRWKRLEAALVAAGLLGVRLVARNWRKEEAARALRELVFMNKMMMVMRDPALKATIRAVREAIQPPPKRVRGKPGRPRVYSAEAQEYAAKFHAEHPDVSYPALRRICQGKFPDTKLPCLDGWNFRYWVNNYKKKEKGVQTP
jgi:hypothetical protein